MIKKLLLCIAAFTLPFAIPLIGMAANTQRLRNDMPDYLKGFQATVKRQVIAYPESFFLSGSEDVRMIALTFDDGPVGDNTSLLLDILAEEQVSATFFVIGSKAKQYPDLIKRIVAEGHELGNHSWSHPDLRKYTNMKVLQNELEPTTQIIQDIVGFTPLIMRPPYGALRDDTIEFLAEEGWLIINWSIDSFDWDTTQNSAVEITEKVLKYSHPGAIVLMHSGENLHGTVSALPEIIRSLREDGYHFVTVSELLGF